MMIRCVVVGCCYYTPLLLILCSVLIVTSFTIQNNHPCSRQIRSYSNNYDATHLYSTTIIAAAQVLDEGDPTSFNNYPTHEETIAMNTQMHHDAIKKSEETFYGFYHPDGFTEFNLDMSPSTWISYSLPEKKEEEQEEMIVSCPSSFLDSSPLHSSTNGEEATVLTNANTVVNIWDTFLHLDKRIIPPPFNSPKDLARTSQTPILTSDECFSIISECENHFYGWGKSNERYGTPADRVGYMIPLESLSYTYTFVNFELLPRLFPAISLAFSDTCGTSGSSGGDSGSGGVRINPENLRLGGCRVVKYDADDGHIELGMHRDGLLVTANIALNDVDEYTGGGTIIEGLDAPIRLPKGNALLHPGDVKHGGNAIMSGVRYVLVCFIFDTTIVPHEKYCQDRMQRDVEAAMAIPLDDAARMEERARLFSSATKHCADAYKFGKLSWNTDSCEDGYDDIIKNFGGRYKPSV
jgi:hypothetical protein